MWAVVDGCRRCRDPQRSLGLDASEDVVTVAFGEGGSQSDLHAVDGDVAVGVGPDLEVREVRTGGALDLVRGALRLGPGHDAGGQGLAARGGGEHEGGRGCGHRDRARRRRRRGTLRAAGKGHAGRGAQKENAGGSRHRVHLRLRVPHSGPTPASLWHRYLLGVAVWRVPSCPLRPLVSITPGLDVSGSRGRAARLREGRRGSGPTRSWAAPPRRGRRGRGGGWWAGTSP